MPGKFRGFDAWNATLTTEHIRFFGLDIICHLDYCIKTSTGTTGVRLEHALGFGHVLEMAAQEVFFEKFVCTKISWP
jgi:hypothetical protein